MSNTTNPADSVSLRYDFSVPELVKTPTGKYLASGYKLTSVVVAHLCGVDDFAALFGGDVNKLAAMFRQMAERKLPASEGWKVEFRGVASLTHRWEETPAENDARWM